jgi:hypothetical protein
MFMFLTDNMTILMLCRWWSFNVRKVVGVISPYGMRKVIAGGSVRVGLVIGLRRRMDAMMWVGVRVGVADVGWRWMYTMRP